MIQKHNLYKLTDQNSQTQNNTTWGPNVTHTAKGENPLLCSAGLIHAYEDPVIAVLLNPIHGNFENPILWTAIGEGELIRDGQLKCGCKTLTTIEQINLPEVTTIQRIAFGILCALEVEKDSTFVKWANSWLAGSNRSKESAAYASWSAADAAARYAVYAANAARYAAWNAAYAAYAARNTANAAAWYAARSAANAAVEKEINLIAIAKKVLTYS
jgi:hypothetical protein